MDVVVALHRPAYNKPVKLYNHRSQCGYIVSCNRWQSDSMNERNNVVQANRTGEQKVIARTYKRTLTHQFSVTPHLRPSWRKEVRVLRLVWNIPVIRIHVSLGLSRIYHKRIDFQ